ncbi:MAG: MaoC/PaaZ C-terminal domain-containing protein [Clostridia bacterium]|nr:MaoC/PaaZ C-terminal domain-containing protein [Clostridia bacterium]
MGYITRGKTFDDFIIDDEIFTAARTITEADVVNFAGLSGDFNPLHTDAELGKKSGFGERIAHGALVSAVATGQVNQLGIFEGTTIAVAQVTTKYSGAVRFGDTVNTIIKCIDKKESKKPDRGVATFQVTVFNQHGQVVQEGEWIIILSRKL